MSTDPARSRWISELSVRLGLVSGACFAAAGVYAGMSGMAPKLVEGVPQVVLTILVLTAMAIGFAGFLAHGWTHRKMTGQSSNEGSSK